MSNDLVELTNTELDAVSGGKTNALAMNFGNAVTQVNQAQNSGAAMGSGNVTQNLTNTGNNSRKSNERLCCAIHSLSAEEFISLHPGGRPCRPATRNCRP